MSQLKSFDLKEDPFPFLRECVKHHKTDPNFKLIYLGSVNGFLANSFYRDCQEKGPTLILVKNEHGRLFGGFTTNNWKEPTIIWNKTERQHKYYYQTFSGPNAVLFSLDLKKVFRLYKGRTSFKLDQETNIAGPLLGELIIGMIALQQPAPASTLGSILMHKEFLVRTSPEEILPE